MGPLGPLDVGHKNLCRSWGVHSRRRHWQRLRACVQVVQHDDETPARRHRADLCRDAKINDVGGKHDDARALPDPEINLDDIRSNSLFLGQNFPVLSKKFPVPLSGEFGSKATKSLGVCDPLSRDPGPKLKNSLLISLLAGNFVAETCSTSTASSTTQSRVCGDFQVSAK
jgi:hypothetical protein